MPVIIYNDIPSGNIVEERIAGHNIDVNIRGDVANPSFSQWFNFKLRGVIGQDYVITILNASKVSYPQGWGAHEATFKTSASYDGTNWFYVPTTYDKTQGQLTMNVHLDQEEVQLAYFPPYTEQQHLDLMAAIQAETTWTVTALGKTNGAEGRDITLITVGEPSPEKKKIWFKS